MPDAVALGVALGVCVLPGLAALTALGVRRPLMLIALAAPVSVATAGVTGTAMVILGGGFGAVALGVSTATLGAVGLIRWRRAQRRTGRVARHPGLGRMSLAIGWMLVAAGAGIGVLTWLRALSGLATYPQEHDSVVHTLLTAYISRTGQGAPWQLLPVDVLDGEPAFFYPAGMHLLAAATGDIVGDSIVGLNAVTVILLAAMLSVSAAVLTATAAMRLGYRPETAALAGGLASLVAAGLYRPTFQLAHDGGALPNAAALALAPSVVAGLLLLPAAPRRAAVAVGLASAGVVWVHPSAAVSVGVIALAWWLGDAFTRAGRADMGRLPVSLGVTAITAAVTLIPFMFAAATAVSRTAAFPPDIPPVGVSDAIGSTLGLAYGGYLDPTRSTGQLWAAGLTALGLAAILALRRAHGPLVAWSMWVAITIAYFLSPATGIETIVTSAFYKAMVRVWSHVSLLVPVLAGVGLLVVAAHLAVLLRRASLRFVPFSTSAWACGLVVLLFATYAAGPAREYAVRNAQALATRYSEPHFVRVDRDDRRAAAWLAERIRPGQRVLNSANDGSTFLYVEYGIPVVNVSTLGLAGAPYTYGLLNSFKEYPSNRRVREWLFELNVEWVYVDSEAPSIGSGGSPEDWAGGSGFDLAPGLQNLNALPGLRPEFRSGSVRVYSLSLEEAGFAIE